MTFALRTSLTRPDGSNINLSYSLPSLDSRHSVIVGTDNDINPTLLSRARLDSDILHQRWNRASDTTIPATQNGGFIFLPSIGFDSDESQNNPGNNREDARVDRNLIEIELNRDVQNEQQRFSLSDWNSAQETGHFLSDVSDRWRTSLRHYSNIFIDFLDINVFGGEGGRTRSEPESVHQSRTLESAGRRTFIPLNGESLIIAQGVNRVATNNMFLDSLYPSIRSTTIVTAPNTEYLVRAVQSPFMTAGRAEFSGSHISIDIQNERLRVDRIQQPVMVPENIKTFTDWRLFIATWFSQNLAFYILSLLVVAGLISGTISGIFSSLRRKEEKQIKRQVKS